MKTFIVAECGINACGNVDEAKRQIDLAALSGADAVKFQVYDAYRLYAGNTKAQYFKDSERGQFTEEQLRILADYSPIEWFATPFDTKAVELLESIGVKRYKIASRSLVDTELLKAVADTFKPVILSTGNWGSSEISIALSILLAKCSVTLLYCVPSYPTKLSEVDFGKMKNLAEDYNLPVGFSDHTMGIVAAIDAVRIGATVIEKHFTASRSLPGCDQICSLEPAEMKLMVKSIRQVEH